MRTKTMRVWWVALALLAALPVLAQGDGSLGDSATSAQNDLDAALKELADLRKAIAAEKLPMSRELSRKEAELREVRAEFEDVARTLDTRSLELANLQNQTKALREQKAYLSSQLDEYIRNFEPRVLHITELDRYREQLDGALLAGEDAEKTATEVFRAQTVMVETSIDRLLDLLGGGRFAGTAADENGKVTDVEFALIGPVALYSAKDGSSAGLAEQRLGSLEPRMVPYEQPELNEAAKAVVVAGAGRLPFDPTLGDALKIEATQDSLVEHIKKGGIVMVPILMLASAALLVALAKWFQLSRVRRPPDRKVKAILDALKRRDYDAAEKKIKEIGGPTGEMLEAGIENVHEPKELTEEVMFEKMLDTRLRLQSFLSFIAVSAAAAPLLGLLGTVTGIINTFKLITVFGTGDAKTLSSGISEALITTEFGLIVAIPSLLLHAYLSRKSRRMVDSMEKTAVSFLNRIPRTPASAPASASEPAPATVDGAVGGGDLPMGLRPATVRAAPVETDH
jgi:biopolymer transport protein ExbB